MTFLRKGGLQNIAINIGFNQPNVIKVTYFTDDIRRDEGITMRETKKHVLYARTHTHMTIRITRLQQEEETYQPIQDDQHDLQW